ncbi:iron-hydroxamate ABC transporter substrate-binding protein [Edaphobacillus lindanitolerans]|uniref:Iron complex transport system substrate-binding protein n=1 Tax=Edaphobacillus lindanitolerans TaxID=550447 RepID=A0A1U7PN04_9BACI|nr:iron-hydroxamate ABC transporter substrate-binding protein [Edaphobacillus lindanitolerans]SIT71687.1 iron complex transport system substrate-binding protein [Edaphobacillus lindanitolerans]
MNRKLLLFLTLLTALALAACGGKSDNNSGKQEQGDASKTSSETITYESETGPVEVPADPKRVVVLSSYAGDLIKLGVPIVGVDSWSADNPNFRDGLKNAEVVSNEDVEKIIELEPDLIIGLNNIQNADKLEKIAPTVLFTYGKNDYLQQHIEVAKVVNKEKEATEWADDFRKRAKETGEKIKAKIGADATVTVVENYEKQFYLFGDNWGRGTEVLYQAMGLKMPDKVKEVALEPGYFAISQEVLGDYTGDYVVMSLAEDQDTSFMDAGWFKEMDAVKNDRLIKSNAKTAYFNDAMTLDDQLKFFEEQFLGAE